jgi:hypothetical protein
MYGATTLHSCASKQPRVTLAGMTVLTHAVPPPLAEEGAARRTYAVLYLVRKPVDSATSWRFHQPPPTAWNNATVSEYRAARAWIKASSACR